MIIEDGAGGDYKAKVDEFNRLLSLATIQNEEKYVSLNNGGTFLFSTGGFQSITTVDTEHASFYVKNTSTTKRLFVKSMRTCAEQVHKVVLYKNPTGGTLISNASAGTKENMNFSSSNAADANVYVGGEGITVSGGVHLAQHINRAGHSVTDFGNSLILDRDDSLALTFNLSAAGDACVLMIAYYL